MKNALTVIASGNTLPSTRKVKSGEVAVRSTFDEIAGPLDVAVYCERFLAEQTFVKYLGSAQEPISDRYLDRAREIHPRLLPHVAVADAAYTALCNITMPYRDSERINHVLAANMLSFLFAALRKTRGDDENASARLAACVGMFDPISDSVGENIGLWKSLPKHPAILALAVKKLIMLQKFDPMPCELREAMCEVYGRIKRRAGDLAEFLSLLNRADRILFAFDRAAWAEHYANVDAAAMLAMTARTGLTLDDDDRSFALDQMWQAKHEAEETLQITHAAAAQITHAAACKAKPAKRTRKQKREEGERQ
jgi:hypothetical protein